MTGSLQPETVAASFAPRGSFGFALTPRALLLLAAAVLWLLPAFLRPRLAWAAVAWDALLLSAAVADGWRLPAAGCFRAEREWLSAPMLGSPAELELRVHSQAGAAMEAWAIDDLPPALSELPPQVSFVLLPSQAAAARYAIAPRERGDHAAARVYLRYRSQLGLVERWAVAQLPQAVRVYPASAAGDGHSLFLARTRQLELRMRKHRQRGLGRDFESLRDYQEGDDLRDICWTASARRNGLVSRQYQAERSQSVWVLVDAGRLLQARVGAYTKLDHSTATALALSQLATSSGDKVGVLAYGATVQQRVLPNRGHTHLRHVLDALALAHGERGEADHLRATAELGRLQPRRSLVLWLTDVAESTMPPEVMEGAALLMRRHLVLFVTMAQTDVARVAAAQPADVEAMFVAAAAQELRARRERLLLQLREGGALTLETSPGEMTAAVLNTYLEIKEKALL